MFVLNEDNSIYATRGDVVFFVVTAEQDGIKYHFRPGDIVRIKIFGKKDAESVYLQKDFPVTEICEKVEIFLEEKDTKIGEVISKPKDYWYEVELNPGVYAQTIIGYDEDGPKVFKLFPEGDDINEYQPEPEDFPVVDSELDMTSPRPVANSTVAKAIAQITDVCNDTLDAVASIHVTPQMFGAAGDGVVDDTEAIQAAIDSGKPVLIPSGVYRLTSPLEIKRDNVTIQSSAGSIEYYGVRFVFDGCDGIHVHGGYRYITIRGIGIFASSADNENVAIRFIPGDNGNEVHRFNFEHGFITNFYYGVTESMDGATMTLWNCGFRHVRTDNVNTAILFGSYSNGNFGVFFEDFYTDNSRVTVKQSKLSFIGCNFGIRQSQVISMTENVYANFINCNFEYDEDPGEGYAIKLNGKEYIFENCQFVFMGDSCTMFSTGTDMYLLRFVGCHSTNKTGGSASMFPDTPAFGRNGAIQFVGSQVVERPYSANNWYDGGLIPNSTSIIKAYDTCDRGYDSQAIRFSGDREQVEFYNPSDDHSTKEWVDVFGNSIDGRSSYPFAIGNGFYLDAGQVAVTGDTFTINYNRQVDGVLLLENPPITSWGGTDEPILKIVRDNTGAYTGQKESLAVFRVLKWDNGEWVSNDTSFSVKWLKISR